MLAVGGCYRLASAVSEEGALGALNGWEWAASAISLAAPSAQVQQPAEPAQTRIAQIYPYQPPAYAVPQTSPWETHKSPARGACPAAGRSRIHDPGRRSLPHGRIRGSWSWTRPRARHRRAVTSCFRPYLDRHITTSLINRGQYRYSAHWTNLSRIQSTYGVDPSVIMAIYGKETSYGSVTGSFDLLDALASLAYEGRRRSMFEAEFISALKLMDQGVRRSQLKGSYAGATGYPQFMPSVALRLRTDGDGDGYADIWRNEDDAFASIANYLRDAGWKRNVPWGVPVRIPPTLNRAAIKSRLNPPRCPRSIAVTAGGLRSGSGGRSGSCRAARDFPTMRWPR